MAQTTERISNAEAKDQASRIVEAWGRGEIKHSQIVERADTKTTTDMTRSARLDIFASRHALVYIGR